MCDELLDRGNIDWLGQVMIEAGFQRAALVFFLTKSCHGDEDDVGSRLGSNSLRCLVPIEARHPDIEERKLRGEG